ncbi:MAG: hypothetical protein BGN88_09505 [Clostridiales bacterium 43-6]|nr:MAG: hypothetical protein BGN88_09505 [Clostridiales bacterium 43-6]
MSECRIKVIKGILAGFYYILAFVILMTYAIWRIDHPSAGDKYLILMFIGLIPAAIMGFLLGSLFTNKKFKFFKLLFYFHGTGCAIGAVIGIPYGTWTYLFS